MSIAQYIADIFSIRNDDTVANITANNTPVANKNSKVFFQC